MSGWRDVNDFIYRPVILTLMVYVCQKESMQRCAFEVLANHYLCRLRRVKDYGFRDFK